MDAYHLSVVHPRYTVQGIQGEFDVVVQVSSQRLGVVRGGCDVQDGGVRGVDDCYFDGAGQRFPYLGAPCFCYVVFFLSVLAGVKTLPPLVWRGRGLSFGGRSSRRGVRFINPRTPCTES